MECKTLIELVENCLIGMNYFHWSDGRTTSSSIDWRFGSRRLVMIRPRPRAALQALTNPTRRVGGLEGNLCEEYVGESLALLIDAWQRLRRPVQ